MGTASSVIWLPRIRLVRIWNSLLPNLANRNGRRPAALVSLGGKNHVIVLPELQAAVCPGIKVGARGDLAADTLALAGTRGLVEGSPPHDRRLVDALGLVDVVGAVVLDCLVSTRIPSLPAPPTRLPTVFQLLL